MPRSERSVADKQKQIQKAAKEKGQSKLVSFFTRQKPSVDDQASEAEPEVTEGTTDCLTDDNAQKNEETSSRCNPTET